MTTIARSHPAPRRHRLFHPRTWPLWAAVLAATAAIIVLGAPGPWPFGNSAVQGDVNLGPGDRFTPASITVREGDTVTWHFDGNSHTVTAGGGPGQAFDSGGRSTGTFSHAFDRAGTFPYLCVYHSGMKGTIVVLPADAATPPPATTAPAATPAPVAGTTPVPAAAAIVLAAAGPAGAVDTAAPAITHLAVTVPRHCRGGRCAATAHLTLSEGATVTVAARGRHLASTVLAAGADRLRVALTGVPYGKARLRFVAVDGTGNRSASLSRAIIVRR